MKKVTVLLPVYNGALFLEDTIKSVLNQTYLDFDFLILDDVSTDNSADIIQSFDDERIIYHLNDTNMGSVGNPMHGMSLCHTEYIARIDQDDLWDSTKLAKQVRIMDENPEIGICGTSIQLFGDKTGVKIFPLTNEPLKVSFLFFCAMSHPSVCFRRSFLKKTNISYDVKYKLADDYKMWIDAIQLTQIYNIPEPLTFYRQHENQICSEKNRIQQQKTTNKIQLEMLYRVYPNATDEEIKFHIEKYVSYQIGNEKDLKKHINWTKKLISENQKTGYIAPKIMQKEIQTYLQTSIKQYMQQTYFAKRNRFLQLFYYILSGSFRHLSLKRNMSLLKNIIIKSK